jgi:RNA polymerase sigma factor (sigma-70 family)
MQELDDITLLRQYVERNSEEAFAALVTRHINKVYSVALRHTRNPHQAEEITQAVFVILAVKARHLRKGVILSGWFYQTARLSAVTLLRSEIRRARREQEAYMQTILNESETDAWTQIAPWLDAAMAGLNELDRHAVVLRATLGALSGLAALAGTTTSGVGFGRANHPATKPTTSAATIDPTMSGFRDRSPGNPRSGSTGRPSETARAARCFAGRQSPGPAIAPGDSDSLAGSETIPDPNACSTHNGPGVWCSIWVHLG